jgi:hypothetical protein
MHLAAIIQIVKIWSTEEPKKVMPLLNDGNLFRVGCVESGKHLASAGLDVAADGREVTAGKVLEVQTATSGHS